MLTLGVAVVAAAAPAIARAEPACTIVDRDGPFAACFDPGNRLAVDGGSVGYGARLDLRHAVDVDGEDITWRLHHHSAVLVEPGGAITGVVYAGRYLRHARDGHIVLPLGAPRKLFVPFDIGAEAELGRARGRLDDPLIELTVFRGAALIELTRSNRFQRRVAVGVVGRWDLRLDRDTRELQRHAVAPFSLGMVDLYAESDDGLMSAGLRLEGGTAWSTDGGWATAFAGEATVERVVLAVNDRPVSVFASAGYELDRDEVRGELGVRFAIVTRRVR